MGVSNNDKSCIARRLRQARKSAGISQRTLGELADIDPRSASARINQYETGKHTPHFTVLKQLGKVLNFPVSFFYEEDDVLADVILKLYRLPELERKEVIEMLSTRLDPRPSEA